jgi:TolB-like protein
MKSFSNFTKLRNLLYDQGSLLCNTRNNNNNSGNRTGTKVNYIIGGSAQRFKNQVRIRVQLINAVTDNLLWGDT